jgi:hypothetical protein
MNKKSFVFDLLEWHWLPFLRHVGVMKWLRVHSGDGTHHLLEEEVILDCFALCMYLIHLCVRCHDSLHLMLKSRASIHEMVDPTQVMSCVTCYQKVFLKSIDSHLRSPHTNVKIFIFCSTESFSPVQGFAVT